MDNQTPSLDGSPGGESNQSSYKRIPCDELIARYKGYPALQGRIEALCHATRKALAEQTEELEAEEESGPEEEKKRKLPSLPKITLENLDLPVRIKDPSIKIRDKAVHEYDDKSKKHRIYNTEGDLIYEGDKVPKQIEDGKKVWDVDVKQDGTVRLTHDTKFRPIKASLNAMFVIDAANLIMEAYEYGAFENLDKAAEYGKYILDGIIEYGDDVIQAIMDQDVVKVGEMLFDTIEPVEPVTKLLRHVAEATTGDKHGFDDMLKPVEDVKEGAKEVVRNYVHSIADNNPVDGWAGRVADAVNPITNYGVGISGILDAAGASDAAEEVRNVLEPMREAQGTFVKDAADTISTVAKDVVESEPVQTVVHAVEEGVDKVANSEPVKAIRNFFGV